VCENEQQCSLSLSTSTSLSSSLFSFAGQPHPSAAAASTHTPSTMEDVPDSKDYSFPGEELKILEWWDEVRWNRERGRRSRRRRRPRVLERAAPQTVRPRVP
jgi:hypothetical protein